MADLKHHRPLPRRAHPGGPGAKAVLAAAVSAALWAAGSGPARAQAAVSAAATVT